MLFFFHMYGDSFNQLVRNGPHWELELFIGSIQMLVFDIIVGALVWPRIKHRINRSIQSEHAHEKLLEARVTALEARFHDNRA